MTRTADLAVPFLCELCCILCIPFALEDPSFYTVKDTGELGMNAGICPVDLSASA